MAQKQTAIEATITRNKLALVFANGERIDVDANELSAEICHAALMHGLKQKLVDAAAIARNTDTGRSATADDKYNAVKAVYDRLMAGEWNARREGGGNTGGLLQRALVRIYEGRKTADEIRAFLDGKSDAEKAALRKVKAVADMIETIKAESANTSGIDAGAMLDELGQGLE